MKINLLFLLLCCPMLLVAQQNGVIKKYNAHIIQFVNNGTNPRIKVVIDDDLKDQYALQQFSDSTLVFKNEKENDEYDKLYKKQQKVVDEKREMLGKISILKDNNKTSDAQKLQEKYDKLKIEPIDVRKYINNRTFLKAGMEIFIVFDYFDRTNECKVKLIKVLDDFDKKESIKGVLEKTSEIAVVDGKKVKLNKGIVIKGKNRSKEEGGYEGKTFFGFHEMDPGMILELKGHYQEDGIFIVNEGEAYPYDYSNVDEILKNNLKKVLNFNLKSKTISIGSQSFEILTDTAITNFVTKVGNSLIPIYLKTLNEKSQNYIPFKFHVLVNDEFNACAYPDGNVFVNTGLILALQNTSQLASVMSHEIAHVTNKHGKKQYEVNQNIKLAGDIIETGKQGIGLLNAFNGKQSNSSTQNEKKSLADTAAAIMGIPKQDIATMFKTYGGAIFTSYYSRELETQADRSGLYFLERAGYDPREASEMWYTLNKGAKKDEDLEKVSIFDKFKNFGKTLITSLYNSHPETIKRAHSIDKLIARNFQEKDFAENNTKYQTQQKDYTKFKEKLKSILTPPPPVVKDVKPQEPVLQPSSIVPKKDTKQPKKTTKKN